MIKQLVQSLTTLTEPVLTPNYLPAPWTVAHEILCP